ncbi:transposase
MFVVRGSHEEAVNALEAVKQSNPVLRPNAYYPFPCGKEIGGWKYDRCNWPDPSQEIGRHFLLTKFARDIRPDVLWEMSEKAAYATFCAFRWSANKGKAFCPKCGNLEPYAIRRRRFHCSDQACMREFSVTSGTVFHPRKLSFKKIMMAIWEKAFMAVACKNKLQSAYHHLDHMDLKSSTAIKDTDDYGGIGIEEFSRRIQADNDALYGSVIRNAFWEDFLHCMVLVSA